MAGFFLVLASRDFFPRLAGRGGCAVEVGVFRGDFSQLLLQTLEPQQLHLVDQWSLNWKEINPFPDTPRHLEKLIGDLKQFAGTDDVNIGLEQAYRSVCERFAGNQKVKILRKASAQAAALFSDNSIDYLYVDANHSYEFVFRDLLEWWPKVRPGGLITMNDYYESAIANHAYGVIPAVATAMKRLPLKPLALSWSGFSDCVLYKEPRSTYTDTFLSNLLSQNVPLVHLPNDIIGNYHHVAVQANGAIRTELPSFVLGTS
jgi:hypothetical protein